VPHGWVDIIDIGTVFFKGSRKWWVFIIDVLAVGAKWRIIYFWTTLGGRSGAQSGCN